MLSTTKQSQGRQNSTTCAQRYLPKRITLSFQCYVDIYKIITHVACPVTLTYIRRVVKVHIIHILTNWHKEHANWSWGQWQVVN